MRAFQGSGRWAAIMLLAAGAMAASSVLVVGNAQRLRLVKGART